MFCKEDGIVQQTAGKQAADARPRTTARRGHPWVQRLAIACVACLVAIGITPSAVRAFSWVDLLIQGVQVYQIANLSDREEVSLGQRIDREIRTEVRISRDSQAIALVNSIGRELIPYSKRPDIPWTFQVVEDKDINAFATMGGFVYINTGTIAAADNRAQLASVIGHEMGHIAGKHALEQMKQMAIAQGVAVAAGVDSNLLVQLGTEIALRLPNSREAEFDADRRGLTAIAQAGYAPQAMPDFMQKLVRSSNGVPSFLSTHPAAQERIVALNDTIRQNNLSGSGGLNDKNYQQRWRNRFR